MDEQVRIHLCEDEENLGTILKELLESKHYKVDLCADGEQGWKAFRLHKYDLCLLDIMMPKRDGLTLAKDIRSMRDDVPIIFLTALGMRENILEGFRSGADDYIRPSSDVQLSMMPRGSHNVSTILVDIPSTRQTKRLPATSSLVA